ncbi:MAG: hypothetical protein P8Y97_00910 [Candidatus Lokiarchaeota archaeon]
MNKDMENYRMIKCKILEKWKKEFKKFIEKYSNGFDDFELEENLGRCPCEGCLSREEAYNRN